MSEWAIVLCCIACWANGVIIGWCLYDFKFYKRNLDKAREAEREFFGPCNDVKFYKIDFK